jgi:hypothetical protein
MEAVYSEMSGLLHTLQHMRPRRENHKPAIISWKSSCLRVVLYMEMAITWLEMEELVFTRKLNRCFPTTESCPLSSERRMWSDLQVRATQCKIIP